MMDHEAITRFLTAIGDQVRLQILFTLGGDRMNVGELSSRFSISRPAISHHLKILKDAKVLKSEKIGQEVYYWIDKPLIIAELHGLADSIEAFIKTPD